MVLFGEGDVAAVVVVVVGAVGRLDRHFGKLRQTRKWVPDSGQDLRGYVSLKIS